MAMLPCQMSATESSPKLSGGFCPLLIENYGGSNILLPPEKGGKSCCSSKSLLTYLVIMKAEINNPEPTPFPLLTRNDAHKLLLHSTSV